MPFQPAMDDPSNILPSSKNDSSTVLRRNGHVLLLAARIGEPQVDELRFLFFDEIRVLQQASLHILQDVECFQVVCQPADADGARSRQGSFPGIDAQSACCLVPPPIGAADAPTSAVLPPRMPRQEGRLLAAAFTTPKFLPRETGPALVHNPCHGVALHNLLFPIEKKADLSYPVCTIIGHLNFAARHIGAVRSRNNAVRNGLPGNRAILRA